MMNRRWVLALAAGAVAVCGAGPVAASARAVRVDGPWGKAIEVPGLAALSNGQAAQVISVSCPSPGNCAAGRDYRSHGRRQGFVALEANGRWGKALLVPGLVALTRGGFSSEVYSVSCGSVGSCAVGGDYANKRQGSEGFVAVERNGRWGTAAEVPGLTSLNKGGMSGVDVVSCASAGSCVAGGTYGDPHGPKGFVSG